MSALKTIKSFFLVGVFQWKQYLILNGVDWLFLKCSEQISNYITAAANKNEVFVVGIK